MKFLDIELDLILRFLLVILGIVMIGSAMYDYGYRQGKLHTEIKAAQLGYGEFKQINSKEFIWGK